MLYLILNLVAKPKAKKEKKAVKFGDVIADSTKVIIFDKNEPTNKKVRTKHFFRFAKKLKSLTYIIISLPNDAKLSLQ